MTTDVSVVISTHHRTDDARINMEIIRSMWPAELGDIVLIHAYNGHRPWQRYLEDRSVVVPPGASHFIGASQLIDAGAEALYRDHPDVRYGVFLASDSWHYRPERLAGIIEDLRRDGTRLAAGVFGVAGDAHGLKRTPSDPALLPATGLTTDFFIVDLAWAREFRMLPLDLAGFVAAYAPLLAYFQEIVLLEKHMEGRYLSAVRSYLHRVDWHKDSLGSEGIRQARSMLRLLHERPIDPLGKCAPPHKGHWPDFGLITIEDPRPKQAAMRAEPTLRGGPVLARFLDDEDLSWFNPELEC